MQETVTPAALDAIDLRVLDQLQRDASLSYEALAKLVFVSPATCIRRVKRLVDAAVIDRRVAILNAEALGPSLSAFVEVTLDRQGAEHLAAFEARAQAEGAVLQCHRVSPGPDFMLMAVVADMPAWNAFVQRLFTQDANVRNVKTFFSVLRSKHETALPLPAAPSAASAPPGP